jgi:hypothetical protein
VLFRSGSLRPTGVFVGAAIPEGGPPAFPRAATSVPGGKRARFEVGESLKRLDFVVEFAYRVWLPSSGRSRPPAFDLVVAREGRIFLELPLG